MRLGARRSTKKYPDDPFFAPKKNMIETIASIVLVGLVLWLVFYFVTKFISDAVPLKIIGALLAVFFLIYVYRVLVAGGPVFWRHI
jgi:uncharacterized membrane protein YccC